MDRAREALRRAVSEDFPPDCDEAARLNVCRRVHES
jgi:hypothetical protein